MVPAVTARRAAPMPAEARRAAIIEAVLPLLVEQGEAVTTRALARAAGVSEGTLFNVFADKDELLAAALAAALDQEPLEQAIAAIDPGSPFDQRLVEATRLVQHRIVDIWRLVSSLGAHHVPADGPLPDSAALTALFASATDRIAVDPLDAARLLRALTLALTHPMLTVEPLTAEQIVERLLHGIGNGGVGSRDDAGGGRDRDGSAEVDADADSSAHAAADASAHAARGARR